MIKQNTPEWHEMRRSRVGASDACIILGVSPWTTPYQLYYQKMGLLEVRETPAMRYGKAMEECVLLEFEKQTGLSMFPRVVISDIYPWMMASLDGMTIEGDVGVEIKCPSKICHESAVSGIVPNKYMPQLQHQMFVTGLSSIFYFSFHSLGTAIINVARNDIYIDDMIIKEKEFYECMVNFSPPPKTKKDLKIHID